MTAASGSPRRRRRHSRPEPSYVRTSKFDGSKSIDLKEFVQNEDIKRQIEQLAERDK